MRAEKSNLDSAESVVSMRWNPPASDHSRRPSGLRRIPTPGLQAGSDNRKKAAKGKPHNVTGKTNKRRNPQTARANATTLATRSQSSTRRLTMRSPSNAQSLTAVAMSSLARVSLVPALTVPLASKRWPGDVRPRAEPTAALTGSTSAHLPGSPVLRTAHFLCPTSLSSSRPRSAR